MLRSEYNDVLKDKAQNFEQQNFRMADISNLKISERANVEWPNLRVSPQ